MKSVTLYTASYCPYCVRAKELLQRKGISFHEIDVTDPNTRADMVLKAGGRKTVPQIFIEDIHVGGYDDLYALDQKKVLDAMLQDA